MAKYLLKYQIYATARFDIEAESEEEAEEKARKIIFNADTGVFTDLDEEDIYLYNEKNEEIWGKLQRKRWK